MGPLGGVLDDGGIGELFNGLTNLFRRFNFPQQKDSSNPIDREYFDSILTLHGLDSARLSRIAQESVDEWDLQIGMDQEESDIFYLSDFIRRVKGAIEEINDTLLDEMGPELAFSYPLEEAQGMVHDAPSVYIMV